MMEWEEDFYSDEPRSKLTGFIPDKLYEVVERDPLPERTKIISELADRILELKEMSPQGSDRPPSCPGEGIRSEPICPLVGSRDISRGERPGEELER